MTTDHELSVGQVAKRAGVNISTLHYYESKGLIASYRDSANHRRYHRDVLRKISVIRIAQRAGIPLKEIKTALATIPDNKKVTRADWENLSTQWRDNLEQRINELLNLRDNLNSCIGCGCLSLTDCQLVNPEDKLAEQGSGPQQLAKPA